MAISAAKPEVNEASIRYQARTVLADLANEIASTQRLTSSEAVAKIKKASKIRYWLKALDYKEFLTLKQRNQIWYKIIELSGIYDFPTAPVLGEVSRPSILVGEQGPPGPTGPAGGDGGTAFENTDVDTGTETVDSFSYSLGTGVLWRYTVRNAAGTASRSGTIAATILADGSAVAGGDESSATEIGDTSDVTLSVDVSAGTVRLRATAASDNWIVEGTRINFGG